MHNVFSLGILSSIENLLQYLAEINIPYIIYSNYIVE